MQRAAELLFFSTATLDHLSNESYVEVPFKEANLVSGQETQILSPERV